jgi:hypothetical protein
MPKIEKALAALGNFVRTLDEYRVGGVLFIAILAILATMIQVWRA